MRESPAIHSRLIPPGRLRPILAAIRLPADHNPQPKRIDFKHLYAAAEPAPADAADSAFVNHE
jgi:hypothetical protein